MQDSIIQTYLEKTQTYQKEIVAQNERYTLCADRVTKLEDEVTTLAEKNAKLKKWIKALGGTLGASLGVLTVLLVL